MDDAEVMYRRWTGDAEVARYLLRPPHESVEAARAALEDWVSSYGRPDYYRWAIVVGGEGDDPVGSISTVSINEKVSSVQVGYSLGRDWWHQGIMTEALGAVIDFFFDAVGANRVEGRHDPNNPRSGMVMKKCGMLHEGTLRSADWNNDGVCDACWYGILRSDRA